MSFLSGLFGASTDTVDPVIGKTQSEADLEAQREKDYAPGGRVYQAILAKSGKDAAEKAYATVLGHDVINTADVNSVDQQLLDAGVEGLKEGANAELAAVNAALKLPFQGVGQFALKAIPWQVWLLGAALLFFYLGGAKVFRK